LAEGYGVNAIESFWFFAVMSRYKRVITGAPPFALDLCVRKVFRFLLLMICLNQVEEADLATIDMGRVAGIILGE